MGGLGAIITIILVVGWVVKGLSSAVGNKDEGTQRPQRSLEEWDELQAKRREARQGQQQAMSELRADSSSQNPAQMTMAERIELARQRARQQAGLQGQDDQQAEALRRARAKAQQQAELQQRQNAQRQRAQREQAAQQERAERERAQQKRRRQAEQQAQQEAQAKRQRRGNQQRRTRPQQSQSQPRAATGSKRENVVAKSMQRIHKGHEHATPVVAKLTSKTKGIGGVGSIGSLDRQSLRKAFIMKELLDKPIALRDPQTELFS